MGAGCGTNTPARGLLVYTISAPAQPSSSCARPSSVSGEPLDVPGVPDVNGRDEVEARLASCRSQTPLRRASAEGSDQKSPALAVIAARRMDSLAGQTMAPRWPLRLPAGGPAGLIWTRLPVARDSWTARVTARLRQHCHPRGPAARSRARVPSSASLTGHHMRGRTGARHPSPGSF